MAKKRLTGANVLTLPALKGKRTDYRDDLVRGLSLRVSPDRPDGSPGKRVFAFVFTQRKTRKTIRLDIGRAADANGSPVVTLAQAREKAKELRSAVALGADPRKVEAERQALTVAALADEFVEAEAESWRPKTRSEFLRIIEREIKPALGGRLAADVRRADVRAFVERKAREAPIMANRCLGVLRMVFNWALERERLEMSPCVGMKKPAKEASRDRVLTEEELRKVWTALGDEAGLLGEAFRLCLLTAQRVGEVTAMRWPDIAEEAGAWWWTIPAAKTKAGRSQRVPLSPQAVEVLERLRERTGDGEPVFPSSRGGSIAVHKNAAGRLWVRSGVPDAKIHDLRRTAASYIAGMGEPEFVVARVLNHAQTGVTSIYNRHSYDAEKRRALEAWGRRLAAIVGEQPRQGAEVVSIGRRA